MLIENRPLLTLYQKLLAIFSYILKEKYISELGIVNLSEIRLNVTVYLHNLHANTCHFAKRYYQVTLFCIIRVTSRNTISVDVPSPPFHLGGGGGEVRLHMGWYGLSSATKFTYFKHITLSYLQVAKKIDHTPSVIYHQAT